MSQRQLLNEQSANSFAFKSTMKVVFFLLEKMYLIQKLSISVTFDTTEAFKGGFPHLDAHVHFSASTPLHEQAMQKWNRICLLLCRIGFVQGGSHCISRAWGMSHRWLQPLWERCWLLLRAVHCKWNRWEKLMNCDTGTEKQQASHSKQHTARDWAKSCPRLWY